MTVDEARESGFNIAQTDSEKMVNNAKTALPIGIAVLVFLLGMMAFCFCCRRGKKNDGRKGKKGKNDEKNGKKNFSSSDESGCFSSDVVSTDVTL